MLKEIELLVIELLKMKINRVTNDITHRVALFIGWFMMTIVLIIVAMFAVAFFALAITYLLAEVMPLWGAALITVGLFLLILLLLYLLRDPLFVKPVRRKLNQVIKSKLPNEFE